MDEPERMAFIIRSTMTAVLKLPTASISTRNVSSKTFIGIVITASALLCSPKVRKVWPILLKKSKSSTTNSITPTSPKSRMSATPKSGTPSETAPPKICLPAENLPRRKHLSAWNAGEPRFAQRTFSNRHRIYG